MSHEVTKTELDSPVVKQRTEDKSAELNEGDLDGVAGGVASRTGVTSSLKTTKTIPGQQTHP